jgi:N-acetylmuramoyl-L-alanine amidase
VDIIQDFIPAGRRNRPGTSLTGPHYVTVHDTGNMSNGANALAHAKYAKSDGAASLPVSWHYTVDDRRIVQHLPLGEVGYHTGDSVGNRSSLGIEIAENADGDRAKAEANAIVLIAALLRTFRLGVSAVVPHKQWNNKQCPHILLARPGGWDTFTAAISARLEEPAPSPPLIGLDPAPTSPPTPPPTQDPSIDMQQLQSELSALQSQVAHLEADLATLAKRVQAAATALLQQEGQ